MDMLLLSKSLKLKQNVMTKFNAQFTKFFSAQSKNIPVNVTVHTV